jgi:hypothetical protein
MNSAFMKQCLCGLKLRWTIIQIAFFLPKGKLRYAVPSAMSGALGLVEINITVSSAKHHNILKEVMSADFNY